MDQLLQKVMHQVWFGKYSSETSAITNCINYGQVKSIEGSAAGIKSVVPCLCYNCYNMGELISGVGDNLYGAGRNMCRWIWRRNC